MRTNTLIRTGYAPANGLQMYYEIHGAGQPLILLHGGLGLSSMLGEILTDFAQSQLVITVDLQAHGHTADIDRPLRFELMADDIAALLSHLGVEKANIIGYSLGGGVALRTAIQYPQVVKKLVLVSTPFRQDGWYPEVVANMAQLSGAAAEFMKESPMYKAYVQVAPKPENFPMLLDKIGDLLQKKYDWTQEVAALKIPAMLVYGDADSIPPAHAAQFFELLGGGKADPGWDRTGMPDARLAILPATTHYDIFSSPALAPMVVPFLGALTHKE